MKTLFQVQKPVFAEFCPNKNLREWWTPSYQTNGPLIRAEVLEFEDCMDAVARIPIGSTTKTDGSEEDGIIRVLIFPRYTDRGCYL